MARATATVGKTVPWRTSLEFVAFLNDISCGEALPLVSLTRSAAAPGGARIIRLRCVALLRPSRGAAPTAAYGGLSRSPCHSGGCVGS